MITWVFIQTKAYFMQDIVDRLDADTRYRFIHKLENKDANASQIYINKKVLNSKYLLLI